MANAVRVTQLIDFSAVLRPSDIKDVIDAGLEYHRRNHLPLHFQQDAPERYSPAYDNQRKVAREGYKPLKQLIQEMTPAQRKAWRDRQKVAQGGAYRRAKAIVDNNAVGKTVTQTTISKGQTVEETMRLSDAKVKTRFAEAKLPLVHTGHLRAKVLRGTGRFIGPVGRRRLTLDVPYYFNFHINGQRHKARALSAITQAEQEKLAWVMDRVMQETLRKNERRAQRRK